MTNRSFSSIFVEIFPLIYPTVKVTFASSLLQKSFWELRGLLTLHTDLMRKLIPLTREHLLLLLVVWSECDTMASLNCCWLMPSVSLIYIDLHCPSLRHLSHTHTHTCSCFHALLFHVWKGCQHVTADPKRLFGDTDGKKDTFVNFKMFMSRMFLQNNIM